MQCFTCLGYCHISVVCSKKPEQNAIVRSAENERKCYYICHDLTHLSKHCPKTITVSSENGGKSEKGGLKGVKGVYRDETGEEY